MAKKRSNKIRLSDIAKKLDVETQEVLDAVDDIHLSIKDNPRASATMDQAEQIAEYIARKHKENNMAKAKTKEKAAKAAPKAEKEAEVTVNVEKTVEVAPKAKKAENPKSPKFGGRVYNTETEGWIYPNKKSLRK